MTDKSIDADIKAQREEIAATVDALAAKADVKSRARAAAAEQKQRVQTNVQDNAPAVAAVAGGIVAAVVLIIVLRRRGKK